MTRNKESKMGRGRRRTGEYLQERGKVRDIAVEIEVKWDEGGKKEAD
jgi:hypothetical protein